MHHRHINTWLHYLALVPASCVRRRVLTASRCPCQLGFRFRQLSACRPSRKTNDQASSSALPTDAACQRTTLEKFYIAWHNHHQRLSPSFTSIKQLIKQAHRTDGRRLDPTTLKYEASPTKGRRVDVRKSMNIPFWDQEHLLSRSIAQLDASNPDEAVKEMKDEDEGDGIVSIAYILSTNPSKLGRSAEQNRSAGTDQIIITCSGFIIRPEHSSQVLVTSCAHPLWQVSGRLDALRTTESITSSVGLVMSSSGKIHVIKEVISALAEFDVLFLGLQEPAKGQAVRLRSLPISPYPPAEQTPVWVHQALTGSHSDRDRWEPTNVIEYKDVIGIAAQVSVDSFVLSLYTLN